MRKYGKLAVTLLLVVAVISSLLPMAFARTWSDVDKFEKEIDMITGLGFMRGEDSKQFFPEDYVDNAELIRVLMNVRGITEGDGVRRFQDVPNDYYAFNAINAAFKLGYITVPQNKMFYPNEKASADRAIEILLDMLNYDAYMSLANETLRQTAQKAGLLEDLTLGEYITKAELAKLIYNSFSCGMMEASGVQGVNAVYKVNNEKTTLSFHNWELITGNVTGNERTSLYYSGVPAPAGKVKIGTEFYLEGESYAGDLLGYNVEAVITKEKTDIPTVIYAAADRKANVLTVKAEEIKSVSGMSFNYSERKYVTLRKDMLLIYNGLATKFDESLLDIEYGSVTFISSTGARKFDIVLVNEYQSFVISSVAKADKKIYVKWGKFNDESYIEYENNIYQDVRIFKNGVRATEADLTPDSAVAVYFADADRDLISIDIGTSSVEGTITTSGVSEETGRKMLALGDDEYLISPNAFGQEFIKLGDSVNLTLDFAGYVVEVKQGANTLNYGVATWVGYDDLEESALVKIFKANGKFETFKTVSDEFKFVIDKTVTRVSAIEVKQRLESMLRSDIIMYSTNKDGLLNKITLSTAYDFKDEIKNQGKFTLYKDYGSNGIAVFNKIAGEVDTTSGTLKEGLLYSDSTVFVIPSDSEYQDDQCKVLKGSAYFTAEHYDKKEKRYPGLKAYNVDLGGKVGMYLHRATAATAKITTDTYDGFSTFIAMKVFDTINSDDEPVKAITGYQAGEKVTYVIASDVITRDNLDINNASFGDVLVFATNSKNEVSEVRFVYIDATQKDITGNLCSGGNGYGETRTFSINHGYAKYMNIAGEYMSLELNDDRAMSIPGAKESIPVYKVSRSDKTIEKASFGDVTFKNFSAKTKGSELIVRTSRGSCSEVFIYEN